VRLPFWLLRLLPMWEYICPKCRKTVEKNSHECPHCGERFPLALKVPPSFLKNPKKLEEYVHKHIFPRVSKAYREYLTQFFTEIFSDGFESGNFSAWDYADGSVAVVESPTHHGSYSAEITVQSADQGARCRKGITPVSELYMREYIRFDSLFTNSGNKGAGLRFATSSNSSIAYTLVDCINNKWGIRQSSNNYFESGTSTINIDTWYCIEMHVVISSTVGVLQLWIDGVLKVDESGLNTGTNQIASVACNMYTQTTEDSPRITYHDCVVVADAYIGPEEEVTLKTVTDSFSLSESVLRNKTLILPDSLGLADSLYGNKVLLLGDSASLSELVTVIIGEVMKYVTDSVNIVDLIYALKILKTPDSLTLVDAVSTPSRVLKALEAIGATDNAVVNKVLQITEAVGLAEIVEVGVGGVKKTRVS